MGLSPEVERLLPGEEEVAFYEEHGYDVTPKVSASPFVKSSSRKDYARQRRSRCSHTVALTTSRPIVSSIRRASRRSRHGLFALAIRFRRVRR